MTQLVKGVEFFLRLRVAGAVGQELLKYRSCFVDRAFQCVDPREIEVGLVEAGSEPDTLLKSCDRLIPPSGAQVENAEVVKSFWIGIPIPVRFL